MKKFHLKQLINLLVLIYLLLSCSKETEGIITKDPSDEDDFIETSVFNGYAKNLTGYSGHNRVKLVFEISSDSIEHFVVSWDNKSSEIFTKTINKNEASSGIIDVIIEDLFEGIHSFDILAYDKENNPAKKSRSIRLQVYGSNYISSLNTRDIKETTFIYNKDPILYWSDSYPKEIALDIFYTNEIGDLDTLRISHSETTATLPGYLKNTDIKYRSLYLPRSECIDTFYTSTVTLPPQNYYASVTTKNIVENSGLVKEVISQTASDIYDSVEYSTLRFIDSNDRHQSAFILKTDLSNDNLTLSPIMPNNDTKFALQTVKTMAEIRNKVDDKVLAAVNADFFRMSGPDAGTPAGPVVIDGKVIKDYSGWGQSITYFGIKKVGKPHIAHVTSLTELDYNNMQGLVGGAVRLVTNGARTSTGGDLHPRTCVGYTRSNVVYTIVIDGRKSGYAEGLEYDDLANIFISLNVSEAINLDGGGSSTMVLKEDDGSFKIVNRPSSNNIPRAVANGLAIMIK